MATPSPSATHCHSIEIWGLHDLNGEPAASGVLLREATYDATANAVQVSAAQMTRSRVGPVYACRATVVCCTQTFSVEASDSVRVVELRVLDNHGASNTCVYRLQVHGTPKDGAQLSLPGH